MRNGIRTATRNGIDLLERVSGDLKMDLMTAVLNEQQNPSPRNNLLNGLKKQIQPIERKSAEYIQRVINEYVQTKQDIFFILYDFKSKEDEKYYFQAVSSSSKEQNLKEVEKDNGKINMTVEIVGGILSVDGNPIRKVRPFGKTYRLENI